MARTKIIDKQLYERRNTSDIFSRNIIMGVLRILNQKLTYENIWNDSDEGIQKVTVPFFFDFSGGGTSSERFIQDNYIHWTSEECSELGIKKYDGDFKLIPYGILTLDSTTIDSGNITNRFVMGQYQKKIGKELKSYVSMLYSIPLTIGFTVNIVCDTMNTMWKIEQAYREYFYKNKTFHINYKGTPVPCRIGFPESITENKTATYQFGSVAGEQSQIRLSFSLQCETYQPVFDPYTEMDAENNIKKFEGGLVIQAKNSDGKNVEASSIGTIIANKIDNDFIIIGQPVKLTWDFNYEKSDLMYAEILLQYEGSDDMVVIDTINNHNAYYLELDENSMPDVHNEIDVIIPNNDDCNIVSQPEIKIYPDKDGIVTQNNVIVIDKGFILTSRPSIDAVASYYNRKNKLVEKHITINILNNAINENNPVNFNQFVYNKDIEYKNVKFFIRDKEKPKIIAAFQDDDKYIRIQ